MSAPTTAVYDRLRALVAIDDPAARDAKPVVEVFTGKQLTTIPTGTAEDVATAFQRARTAQTEWAGRSIDERTKIFAKFHDLVLAHKEEIMDVVQAETGKARRNAQEEVIDLMLNSRYYVKQAKSLLSPYKEQGLIPGLTKALVRRVPKGVVGLIAPWNYPLAMSVSDAVPALIAGNAVVVKPDSQTPFSTLIAAELLYAAGVPRALFAVVPGPGSVVGQAIVEHADFLMFTGSTATGRKLAQQCGARLIGMSAELGGKNPMIVTKDANLGTVAKAATRAAFANAGQLCISIERVYVEDAAYDEFVEKFADATRNMALGASYDFNFDTGSLISGDQLKTVSGHVDDARAKGATVVAGGNPRPDLGPSFYEPTILTGVTDEMVCARNETFGPVVSIYRVANVEEAIAKANDSEYGLNASVWAGSDSEGEAIAARVRTGSVNVGEGYISSYGSTAAPMGGVGASGLGRRHGSEGILKYTESQTIATQHVTPLDPRLGIPERLWAQTFVPLVRAVQVLPWRK